MVAPTSRRHVVTWAAAPGGVVVLFIDQYAFELPLDQAKSVLWRGRAAYLIASGPDPETPMSSHEKIK